MNHIDPEVLKRYYANELNNAQRNALEKQALEDPFLKDAMDGFDENPESFNQFYTNYKSQLKIKKSYTVLIGLTVLVALFAITAIFNKTTDNNQLVNNDINSLDSISNVIIPAEFELIPTAIETLNYILPTEIISVEEVVEDQQKIEKLENTIDLIADQQPENPIEIDDIITPENDYTFEEENFNLHKYGQKSMETMYLFDLLVVNYREVGRENQKITYKRYELGGVSADREGENTAQDLIETEVEISYLTYLEKSMSFFAKGKTKKALNRYLLILEQYPKDLNALFYGGLAYYNLGKHKESIEFFNIIIASNTAVFSEESLWYKAKNLIQLNKKTEAKNILDEIIMRGGFYTKDAMDLKKKI